MNDLITTIHQPATRFGKSSAATRTTNFGTRLPDRSNPSTPPHMAQQVHVTDISCGENLLFCHVLVVLAASKCCPAQRFVLVVRAYEHKPPPLSTPTRESRARTGACCQVKEDYRVKTIERAPIPLHSQTKSLTIKHNVHVHKSNSKPAREPGGVSGSLSWSPGGWA